MSDADELIPNIFESGRVLYIPNGVANLSMKLAMQSRTAGFASRAARIRRLAVRNHWKFKESQKEGEGLVNLTRTSGKQDNPHVIYLIWFFVGKRDFATRWGELDQGKFPKKAVLGP